MLEEMTYEQFAQLAAYEMLVTGRAKPDESDLPALAQRGLEQMRMGR